MQGSLLYSLFRDDVTETTEETICGGGLASLLTGKFETVHEELQEKSHHIQ